MSNSYPFEEDSSKFRGNKDKVLEYLKVIQKRLTNIPVEKLKKELEELIIHVHMNIEWYAEARSKQEQLHKRFFWVSLALVLLIPITITALSNYLSKETLPIIVTFVAGLLSVQKALNSLLEKRRLVALFWSTEANLKDALYTFEGKCREVDFKVEDFRRDIHALVDKARKIVREEQDKFFESYALLTVDSGALIEGLPAQAKKLLEGFGAPARNEQILKSARQDVVRLEAEEEQLMIIVSEYETKLKMTNDESEERNEDLKSLVALRQKLFNLKIELAAAKAKRKYLSA